METFIKGRKKSFFALLKQGVLISKQIKLQRKTMEACIGNMLNYESRLTREALRKWKDLIREDRMTSNLKNDRYGKLKAR